MSSARPFRALVLVLGCACSLACQREPEAPAATGAQPTAEPAADEPAPGKQELLVLAASSLTESFKELKRQHEHKHPGVEVLLSFAGSSALAAQVDQGGVGDVLATASEEHMDALAKEGHVTSAAVFAYNELVVAVPLSNPAKLKAFQDLPKAKRIVLGASNVPIGKYSDALLERAAGSLGAKFRDAVLANVVSREANVRLVLAKIELGEADAAIVYRSDIAQPGCTAPAAAAANACQRAHVIAIPDALGERATYPIALLTHASQPALGRAFIDHVLSDEGQAVLAAHGFISARPPSAEPTK